MSKQIFIISVLVFRKKNKINQSEQSTAGAGKGQPEQEEKLQTGNSSQTEKEMALEKERADWTGAHRLFNLFFA